MKKLAATLAAIILSAGSVAPAFADDNKDMLKNTAMLPVRLAAVTAGMAVGIPVAIMRSASNHVIDYTNDMADKIGGHDSFPPVAMASVLSVPFGLIAGTADGVYYGGKNAISSGYEKPFSTASFSLDSEYK